MYKTRQYQIVHNAKGAEYGHDWTTVTRYEESDFSDKPCFMAYVIRFAFFALLVAGSLYIAGVL